MLADGALWLCWTFFTRRACEQVDFYSYVITNVSLAGGRELDVQRNPQFIGLLVFAFETPVLS